MKNKIKYAVIIFIIGGIIMYTRVNWQNAPSTATPVNAENLNTMDKGIADAHSQLAENAQFSSPKFVNITEREIKPVVTFIDDDGRKELYTRLLPIFESKNVKFGAAIITGLIDNHSNYLTLEQLKDAAGRGLETLSHTVNVNTNLLDGYTEEQIHEQLSQSQQWLKNNGLSYEGFVYPQSTHNSFIRQTTLQYYKYCFASVGFNDKGYIENYHIRRIAFGSWTDNNPTVNGNDEKNTLNYYKACVDYAVANKIWLVFMTHVANQDVSQDAILSDLIDYIQGLGVEILPPSEAFKRKSNKLSLGTTDGDYIFIGEKKIVSNLPKYKNINYSAVNSTTPITAFEKGVMSIAEFLNADASGFPDNAGLLMTFRSERWEGLSFQKFYAYSTDKIYKRTWNTSTGSWGEWKTIAVPTTIFRQTIDCGSIPANSMKDISVSYSGAVGNTPVTIQPSFGLPNGLLYSCHTTGNNIWIRVANITSNPIEAGEREFTFIVRHG